MVPRNFFYKYLPNYTLDHPNNYSGTWLPKVAGAKDNQMEAIIKQWVDYIIIDVDDTEDLKPQEECQLFLNIVLLPRKIKSKVQGCMLSAYHLKYAETE